LLIYNDILVGDAALLPGVTQTLLDIFEAMSGNGDAVLTEHSKRGAVGPAAHRSSLNRLA
jgi:hypothetical protein